MLRLTQSDQSKRLYTKVYVLFKHNVTLKGCLYEAYLNPGYL